MLGGVPCTGGKMYGGRRIDSHSGYPCTFLLYRWRDVRWEGILYRGNICIDPLLLDSFEQILARMHEG
jgi:hypothetical protein